MSGIPFPRKLDPASYSGPMAVYIAASSGQLTASEAAGILDAMVEARRPWWRRRLRALAFAAALGVTVGAAVVHVLNGCTPAPDAAAVEGTLRAAGWTPLAVVSVAGPCATWRAQHRGAGGTLVMDDVRVCCDRGACRVEP